MSEVVKTGIAALDEQIGGGFDNLCSMKEGKLIYCYMNDDQKSMLDR